MMVNCPACKRAHGDLAPGKYECQCNAEFRVDAQANPKKNPAKKNPAKKNPAKKNPTIPTNGMRLGWTRLNDGRLVSARPNGEAYTFANRTQAQNHATKVGGQVYQPPMGRVFYVAVPATKNPAKKNPDMSLDKAMRAARAWAKKSGNRAALAHIDGYISGAYQMEAMQLGHSEIESAVPYIMANIGSWRGDEAREAKKVMKQALADAKKAGGRRRNPNGDWDNEEDYDEGEGHVCMKCGTDYPCTMEDGACEHHNDVCSECRSQSIYRQVEREMDSEDYQGPNPVKSGRGRYVGQAWMLYPTGMPIPAGWEKVGKEHTQGKRQAQPRPGMIWIIRKSLTGTRGLPRSKKKNPHTPMHLAPKASLDAVGEDFGQISQAKINAIGAAAGWAVAQQLMDMMSKLGESLSRAPADATEADLAQVNGHLNGLQQSIGVIDGTLLNSGIAEGLQEIKASGVGGSMEQLEAAIERRLGGMADAAPEPMTEDPGTRRELGFSAKGRKPKSKKASSRSSDEERREIGFPLNNPVKLPKTYKGPAGGHGQAYAYLDALSKEYKEQWNENLQETARKKRLHIKLLDWLKPHMPRNSHVHLPKFIAHWMGDSPGVGSERATWQKAYDRGKAPALVPA